MEWGLFGIPLLFRHLFVKSQADWLQEIESLKICTRPIK